MKYIFVCGLPGSGKGVIRVLLDNSNDDLITCPFQGFGYEIIDDKFDRYLNREKQIDVISRQKKMKSGFIYVGNKVLNIGEFFYLISNSLKDLINSSYGQYIRAASNQNDEQFVKFKFDYKSFINKISSAFENKKKFTNKIKLYEFFIYCFVMEWKKKDINKNNFFFLVSMNNGSKVIENINSYFPRKDFKIISVSRSIEAFVYTNYIRFSSKLKNYSLIFKFIYFISPNNYRKYKRYKSIETKYKKNLILINFDKLINNYKNEMISISKFININFSKKMLIPSLDTKVLHNDFTKKIIDDPYLELNKLKIFFIRLFYYFNKIIS